MKIMRWIGAVLAGWTVIVGCEHGAAPVTADRLVSSEAIARGRPLFVEHCAICHGETGNGHGRRRSGFETRPADFTSEAWRSRTSATEVLETIRDGKRGTSMPAWPALGDDQLADLTAYVLSLGAASRGKL